MTQPQTQRSQPRDSGGIGHRTGRGADRANGSARQRARATTSARRRAGHQAAATTPTACRGRRAQPNRVHRPACHGAHTTAVHPRPARPWASHATNAMPTGWRHPRAGSSEPIAARHHAAWPARRGAPRLPTRKAGTAPMPLCVTAQTDNARAAADGRLLASHKARAPCQATAFRHAGKPACRWFHQSRNCS